MNTKHTPGPWLTDEMMPGDQYRYVFAAKGPIVCRVSAFAAGEANARLIAAAPELLAALKGVLASLEWHADRHGNVGMDAQRRLDAHAAIAKAEVRE